MEVIITEKLMNYLEAKAIKDLTIDYLQNKTC